MGVGKMGLRKSIVCLDWINAICREAESATVFAMKPPSETHRG